MLTRADRTIADALFHVPDVLAAGVRHIGFKDVGVDFAELQRLTGTLREASATVYLEVVSLDAASEAASARVAVALGVDILMGGTRPEVVLPVIAGTPIRYYPFPGEIVGHPSVLAGGIEDIVASARRMVAHDGVHGLDLLAYRFAGDVPELIRRVVAAAGDKPVIVAGSIDRPARVNEVLAAGATGFTVGTAALNGSFPGPPDLCGQLAAIQQAHAAAAL